MGKALVLKVNDRISIPHSELVFDFVRSSGPGGQNVNKVATKAVMKWDVRNSPSLPHDVKRRFFEVFAKRIDKEGAFLLTSQRYRDQKRNVDDCFQKLQSFILQVAAPPKLRKKTKPTKASKRRRLKSKQIQSQKKQMRRPPNGD